MMKNLFKSLLALLLFAAAGCSDDADVMSINGGERFLSLDHAARSGKITVSAPAPWSLKLQTSYGNTERPDWVTLSAEEGPAGYTEIGVEFAANPGAARSALLLFTCAGSTQPFTLSQATDDDSFDSPDYYFYVTFGTMPTLYAGIHALSHDKPASFFYERSKTFEAEAFPAHVQVEVSDNPSADATHDDMHLMREAMKHRIRQINRQNPKAVFGLYVDDLRCRIGYDWFVAQGIDPSRVKVSLLSDGTATYNNFADYFGDPATAEQRWNAYAAEVEALDWNHGGRYPETRGQGALPEFESWEWAYCLSTRPDYRLILQNSSLLESSGPFMTARLGEMHLLSKQPYELLQSLPADRQQQFYRMAKFDYDRFARLFDTGRRNLIVIGTSHSSGESEQTQRAYVDRIMKQYGAEYHVFFKPHPADTSSASYEADFPGLTLLPGQMPFEIFVWSLVDKIDLIGGYPSTVFLTVPVEKVRFIFAPDAASLVRPLNLLFRDASGVEWMQ